MPCDTLGASCVSVRDARPSGIAVSGVRRRTGCCNISVSVGSFFKCPECCDLDLDVVSELAITFCAARMEHFHSSLLVIL